jgi:hypothetical protein
MFVTLRSSNISFVFSSHQAHLISSAPINLAKSIIIGSGQPGGLVITFPSFKATYISFLSSNCLRHDAVYFCIITVINCKCLHHGNLFEFICGDHILQQSYLDASLATVELHLSSLDSLATMCPLSHTIHHSQQKHKEQC